ncbi:hypothetical protein IKU74_05365 [bacterium]|nr:hypothetical protein [bacterium]
MIEKVNISSVNKKNTPKRQMNDVSLSSQPSFKGGLVDGLIWGVQQCEKHPMINVSVLDLSTAIIPRTIVETTAGSKQKDEEGNEKRNWNFFGGFEAFRREASGLIVNCLIPGFIVQGAAKLFKSPIMGDFKKSNLTSVWANAEAYDKIKKFYKNGEATKDSFKDFFKRSILSLEGVDGNAYEKGGIKRFAELLAENPEELKGLNTIDEITSKIKLSANAEKAINDLADAAFNENFKKANVAYKSLVDMTHISENIRFIGEEKYLSNSLESFCVDTPRVLSGIKKEGIKDVEHLAKYFEKAQKLVNVKSIAGLGLIIPLAISMQPINRWITRKMSGRKGAPIYNDFADRKEDRELTPKEKAALLKQKFISVGSMCGVAALSMFMDKPSLKSLFQFKGIFPTMDQARIISTATFASRMAASEDANELREATIRDIATFASFYFLGDYAAKALATGIEYTNKDAKLINRFKQSKPDDNVLKKLWNWAKHTSLKSSDELATAGDKRLRTICQIGNLAFSLVSLGIFIPLYTRTQTNKKKAQQDLAQLNNARTNTTPTGGAGSSAATSSSTVLSSSGHAAAKTSFSAFINS